MKNKKYDIIVRAGTLFQNTIVKCNDDKLSKVVEVLVKDNHVVNIYNNLSKLETKYKYKVTAINHLLEKNRKGCHGTKVRNKLIKELEEN